MLCKTEALQNFASFIRKHPCSRPSSLQLYFKEHHHWWFSVDIFISICFISRKYAFTDVLQNRCSWKLRKIHRKSPLPDSLDSDTDNFLWIFWNFLKHLRLLLISIPSFYCVKKFLFQNRSIFVKYSELF